MKDRMNQWRAELCFFFKPLSLRKFEMMGDFHHSKLYQYITHSIRYVVHKLYYISNEFLVNGQIELFASVLKKIQHVTVSSMKKIQTQRWK